LSRGKWLRAVRANVQAELGGVRSSVRVLTYGLRGGDPLSSLACRCSGLTLVPSVDRLRCSKLKSCSLPTGAYGHRGGTSGVTTSDAYLIGDRSCGIPCPCPFPCSPCRHAWMSSGGRSQAGPSGAGPRLARRRSAFAWKTTKGKASVAWSILSGLARGLSAFVRVEISLRDFVRRSIALGDHSGARASPLAGAQRRQSSWAPRSNSDHGPRQQTVASMSYPNQAGGPAPLFDHTLRASPEAAAPAPNSELLDFPQGVHPPKRQSPDHPTEHSTPPKKHKQSSDPNTDPKQPSK